MTTTYRAQSEKHRVDIFTTYLPHISRFLTFLSHLFIKGLRLKYVEVSNRPWRPELRSRGHDDPRLHHRRLPEDCGLPGPMLQDRAEGVGSSYGILPGKGSTVVKLRKVEVLEDLWKNGLWILESKPPSFEFGSHLALTHAQTVVFPSQLQLENIQWPIATHLFELKSVTIIALSNMATDVWSADLFKGNLGRGYLALFESPRIRVNSRDEIYQYISEFTYKVEVKNIHQG